MLGCGAKNASGAGSDGRKAVDSAMARAVPAAGRRRRGVRRRYVARSCRRSVENVARRILDRRNKLRPPVCFRRRVGQRHLEHLRGDARLRLPGASGQARPPHAGVDADGFGRRQDLHFQDPQRHLLHAGSRLQGQAARTDRRGSGLRFETPSRSVHQESMGVAHRRQGSRHR